MKRSNEPNPTALGDLTSAGEQMAKGDLRAAWEQCLEAVRLRPFHPEALILAGKIAFAAHDVSTAKKCFDRARAMAPGLKDAEMAVIPAPEDQSPFEWPGLDKLVNPGRPRLSVCMIVKNEEAFLAKCLQSVRGIASEMIVIDTGSTDRTAAIAREHGAAVFDYEWTDDFSAARNASIARAHGDWILVLDADEELVPGAADKLQLEMNDPAVIAYELPLINEGRENEGSVYLPRLFRNVPGIAYEGRVHEQITARLRQRTSGWGLKGCVSQAVLLHHGYTREVTATRNKPQRNLRLLQQALKNPPPDPAERAYLLMNLGLETVRTGDLPAGIAHYEQALELLNEAILAKSSISISPEFRATFLHQFAPYLNRAGRLQDLIRLYQTPLARSGDLSASDHYLLGLALGQVGQFEQAQREFQACIDKRHAPTRVPNHAIVLGPAPFQCLASVFTQMRRYADAEKTYQRALAELPNSIDLRLDYARLKLQQGHPLEALRDIHALVNEHPNHTASWIAGAEICLSQPQFLEVALDWTSAAIQRHPSDEVLSSLRCESLLLANDVTAAIKQANGLSDKSSNPRVLAVHLTLTLLDDKAASSAVPAELESRVSQSFLDLYRRIGMAGAAAIIQRLKTKIDLLATTLPLAHKALSQLQR